MAQTLDRREPATGDEQGRRAGWTAGAAGLVAAAVALAVTELLSIIEGVPSLVLAIGNVVIDLAPAAVKDAAIALLGTADKPALLIGIAVVSLASGWVLGLLARRAFALAVVGLAAFALLGIAATAADARAQIGPASISGLLGATAGALALYTLLRRAPVEPSRRAPGRAGVDARRGFLRGAGAFLGLAVAGAFAGRFFRQSSEARAARGRIVLPGVAEPLPPPPDAASLEIDGLAPLYTPNETFYRIDTALSVPQVDVTNWRLRVSGMVKRPFTFTYDGLLGMEQVERDITIACVSNEVGGGLVGNARWQGVPLARLLDRAGVASDASQVVGRSVDGFTVGFPTAAARDGREALVAVAMNGEPLPAEHGYPARLVVAGLYGYVSATKWLSEIELTTLEAFDAYWIPRGWAKQAPIKTQSRIDVPHAAAVPAGETVVAGVAWAPTRGIAKVEVQVDEGAWNEAQLAEALHDDTWRQWRWRWDATHGRHRLRVRATDGQGETQTEERQPPRPDGATGYHTIEVSVDR